MSTPNYSISPALLRELDALAVSMESDILNAQVFDDRELQQLFYQYKGFNHCIAFMKALAHGFDETADGIREHYKGFSYEGFTTELSDEEEEGEE